MNNNQMLLFFPLFLLRCIFSTTEFQDNLTLILPFSQEGKYGQRTFKLTHLCSNCNLEAAMFCSWPYPVFVGYVRVSFI
jgi:hypothetical protein